MSAVASRPRWMRLFALLALLPVSSRAQRSRAVQVTASAAELTRVDHDTPAGAPIERPQVSPGQPLPVQWNALARELARRDRAVRSFQLFAELSGVQREALAAPGLAKWGDLAAAEASAQLLAAAFPARRAEIERLLAAQRQAARLTDQTDLVNLVKRLVAQARAVSRRRCAATLRDGSIDANGRWSSAPDGAPVGESIPRLCPQGGPLPRSPPPPRAATPAFRAALAEVQAAVRAATPEQRATLRDWAAARRRRRSGTRWPIGCSPGTRPTRSARPRCWRR